MISTFNSDNPESLSPEDLHERLRSAQELGNRIGLLGELAVRIDSTRSLPDLLDVLQTDLRRLMAGEWAFLALVATHRKQYDLHALYVGKGDTPPVFSFSLDAGMIGWCLANKSAVVVNCNSVPVACSDVEESFKHSGMNTMLVIPVRVDDEVIGVLGFGSTLDSPYEDLDLWFGQLVALQIALAIKKSSTIVNAQKRIVQIELVNQIASQLTGTLDVSLLLQSAAEALHKQFHYFDVTIFLVDAERQELTLAAQSGQYSDFLPRDYRQQIGKGIVGTVAKERRHIMANDVRKDPRYLTHIYQYTNSELALPIEVEDEVVGVLNVEDAKLDAFDETDVLVLATLCDQLGSALRNARLFEEIKRTNDRLVELDKLKTEFVSIVSHDFRTPLSTIMLAAKSLLRKGEKLTPEHLHEYLNIIIDQAGKLSRMAEDTLSIAKIESGQLNYVFKVVNVEAVIQEAASMVKISSRHKLETSVELSASYVRGDQHKLRQVLQNLISNAVKYSPSGGTITVRVALNEENAEEVVFAVSDRGIGIAPEDFDKLFAKYSRIESGTTKGIAGSGLGLWICREIINVHGGRIWVESEAGKGSTFKFTVKRGESG
jgi:K+-sensing histidine kinase KdpD